jgi:3-deoxy-manno-octulosonate cytidylyltransferase (CMP-KDO synthetase)
MKKKKIILIPSRLDSKRLPGKALFQIENIPIVGHTFYRSNLTKNIDGIYVCSDSNKILTWCKKNNIPCIKTKSKHINGTERIAEAVTKLNLSMEDIIIDVQGDEPLIDPNNITKAISFFEKNNFDIVVPNLKLPREKDSSNIVKLTISNKKQIMWMSRSLIPYSFNKNNNFLNKHLSTIIFTKRTLLKYSKLKPTFNEKIESIELLRALENNMKLGSVNLKGDSFSVDVLEDYLQAINFLKKDKVKLKYLKTRK